MAEGSNAAGKTKEHADRATTLLRRGVEMGFGDVDQLMRSGAYDPLRGHEGFRALLNRLREKTNPQGN